VERNRSTVNDIALSPYNSHDRMKAACCHIPAASDMKKSRKTLHVPNVACTHGGGPFWTDACGGVERCTANPKIIPILFTKMTNPDRREAVAICPTVRRFLLRPAEQGVTQPEIQRCRTANPRLIPSSGKHSVHSGRARPVQALHPSQGPAGCDARSVFSSHMFHAAYQMEFLR